MTEEQIEKKEWLSRAKYTKNALKALERLRNEKRSIAISCGINYENDGTTSGGGKNGTEIKLLNLAEIEEKIEDAKRDLCEAYEEIEAAINSVQSVELRTVLINHYLSLLSWENTAIEMGYSLRSVKYKHLEALDELKIS